MKLKPKLETVQDLRNQIRKTETKKIFVAAHSIDKRVLFVRVSKRAALDTLERQSKFQKLTPGRVSFDKTTGNLYI